MRKVREILRLILKGGLTKREIARSYPIPEQAKLEYEQVQDMDEMSLHQLLKKYSGMKHFAKIRPHPDRAYIHQDKKKKGVTLILLWQEYKKIHPEGYQSTKFCEHYHQWRKKLKVSLRQTYKAGKKMFVDYAGQTVPIHNRVTGKITEASIFVTVLGESNYTCYEAQVDESLGNWIGGHVRTFEYFGRVTKTTFKIKKINFSLTIFPHFYFPLRLITL